MQPTFLLGSATELVSLVSQLPKQKDRLFGFSTLCDLVIRFDLSGSSTGPAATTSGFLGSSSVSGLIEAGSENSEVPSEFVSCLSQACLDVAELLADERDISQRNALGEAWSAVLGKIVLRLAPSLGWPPTRTSLLGSQMLLKLFESLGQFSSILLREKGQSLEDYERAQEFLVKQVMSQENVFIRASLITTVTHFWLESGLKAEANAGHILKGIWDHLQSEYRDEKLAVKLKVQGQAWSRENFLQADALSTFPVDSLVVGVSAALEMARRIPRSAEKIRNMLVKYLKLLVRSPVVTALEEDFVHAALKGVEMFLDQHFPRFVPPKLLEGMTASPYQDHLAWLRSAKESCIFASSRLSKREDEDAVISMEESLLRGTLRNIQVSDEREGDHQVRGKILQPGRVVESLNVASVVDPVR